jgi:LmbE family N-acetylglucosaminyl deacetylase
MKPLKKSLYPTVWLCVVVFFLSPLFVRAQQPKVMNAAEVKVALEKLLTLGTVLYLAAHPDDENTTVLAYFSLGRKMRAGYLGLTRGGGGQNLIGSEKGPLMSALRTYELLAARAFDGTEQFFTRAVDFGYSKTSKESMAIWGKEEILDDMVYVIRKFRPDVILTRFPADGRGGHGHHSASAILAVEAFKAAGDAKRFPEQLKYVKPWQPKRILWNSWAPYYSNTKPEELAKLIKVDVGAYNPLLGKSYVEVAALSRSMHKSQGFGAVARRGERLEYFDLMAGEPAKGDVMDGIDTTWNRVPGSEKVRNLLEKANNSYQAHQPQEILPILLDAYKELQAMPESYWTVRKMKELRDVIRSCTGLWIEAISAGDEVSPGQEMKVTAAVVNRSDFPLILKKIIVPGEYREIIVDKPLPGNKIHREEIAMKVTEKQYTHPFWLRQKPEKGIYPAANHRFKGMAVTPYPFYMKMAVDFKGREITFETPVLYRWRDPVEGEKIHWLAVTPPVTANFSEEVIYFPSKDAQPVDMIIRSGPAPVAGTVKLKLPASWTAKPAQIPFDIKNPLEEKKVTVMVTPPHQNAECRLKVDLVVGGETYHRSRQTINYAHLPLLTLHPEAAAHLVRVDVKRNGRRIGYIMGSGDDIPRYLEQVGYRVAILSDDDLHRMDLSVFDAIITGVRAYNTRDILKHVQKRLMDYVANGGRMVVQYNVSRGFASRGLKMKEIGPYPLKLSRQRVTEEDAKITILQPDHPLLRAPNKITAADFNGWIQERGLYFAEEWDAKYTAPLACSDNGENPLPGGMLFARHGKGTYVFTGYSFFRQLPAGVGGALKLFVNTISTESKVVNVASREIKK